ncbi:enoyl-CoA hydratase/isomerase family protein [Rhodococcus sp. NPDC003383]
MTDESVLLTDLTDGVLTLTLNRPDRRNAITSQMWTLLGERLRDVEPGHDVRAVVLTGAGGTFSSGADLSATAGMDKFPDPSEETRRVNDTVRLLHGLPVPTIAKVRGVTVGAGWNLALGCDFVVATPEARFCQIFTRRALSIDTGGSWLLPRLVGLQQAKRLTMLADMIGADEAHALGLVTWLQPETEIDGFVDALATRLAAGPPIALAQTKSLIDHGIDRTLDEALDGEAAAQAVNLAAPDVLEAFAAFAEKRDPVYRRTSVAER